MSRKTSWFGNSLLVVFCFICLNQSYCCYYYPHIIWLINVWSKPMFLCSKATQKSKQVLNSSARTVCLLLNLFIWQKFLHSLIYFYSCPFSIHAEAKKFWAFEVSILNFDIKSYFKDLKQSWQILCVVASFSSHWRYYFTFIEMLGCFI